MATIERKGWFAYLSGAIWLVLSSRGFLIGLTAVGALGVLISAVVPQIPPNLLADPNKTAQWLNSVPSGWYNLINPLHNLGFTHLAGSRLVLLYHLLLVAALVIQGLILFVPGWARPGRKLALTEFNGSVRVPAEHIRQVAEQSGLEITQLPVRKAANQDLHYWVLGNYSAARWWWLVLTAGVCLYSVLVLDYSNRKIIQVSPGDVLSLPGSLKTSFVLDQVSLSQSGNGKNSLVTSVWKPVSNTDKPPVTVKSGKSITIDGTSLYLVGAGPALKITGKNADGKPLNLLRMPGNDEPHTFKNLQFSEGEQEQYIAIPEENLLLRFTNYTSLPSQGITGRVVALQFYELNTSTLIQQTLVQNSLEFTIQELQFEVTLNQYVQVREIPVFWIWLLIISLIASFMGSLGMLVTPRRLTWLALLTDENESYGALWYPEQDAGQAWLDALLHRVRAYFFNPD